MDGGLVLQLVDYSVAHLLTTLTIHLVMVFRRRNQNRLRPVNRIKHVVDKQWSTAAAGVEITNLAAATDTPTLAANASVETGCTINGIYLKVEIVNTGVTGVLANAYMFVGKNVGNNLTLPVPNAVGINDNKRFIIHQEMVMLQMVDNSNPRTLFNGVIVIPRGYRRFGPQDTLVLHVFSPGVELNACMQCHYKEFR